MLPNQFCYQIPYQYFPMQPSKAPMQTGQIYNSGLNYPINKVFQPSLYPTNIQNNAPFFNYLPYQMPPMQFQPENLR